MVFKPDAVSALRDVQEVIFDPTAVVNPSQKRAVQELALPVVRLEQQTGGPCFSPLFPLAL